MGSSGWETARRSARRRRVRSVRGQDDARQLRLGPASRHARPEVRSGADETRG
jgi:hypothetical protein